MTFCLQGVCSTLKSWSRTFQRSSRVVVSLWKETCTFLRGTQCIRCHTGELRTWMQTVSFTTFDIHPMDSLSLSRECCHYSVSFEGIGSCAIPDWVRTTQWSWFRTPDPPRTEVASTRKGAWRWPTAHCQPSECDRWKSWRRFLCPWRDCDCWELHFQQSRWIRLWWEVLTLKRAWRCPLAQDSSFGMRQLESMEEVSLPGERLWLLRARRSTFSTVTLNQDWRRFWHWKGLEGVHRLKAHHSECDSWKFWRRFLCPWRGWDSWEFDSQDFQQSSWSRKRWRFWHWKGLEGVHRLKAHHSNATAGNFGGGFYARGEVEIAGSSTVKISNSRAEAGNGGGFDTEKGLKVSTGSRLIIRNATAGSDGGGFYALGEVEIAGNSTVKISTSRSWSRKRWRFWHWKGLEGVQRLKTHYSECDSWKHGGGFFAWGETVIAESSTINIFNSHAESGTGGGFDTQKGLKVSTGSRLIIRNATAGSSGGRFLCPWRGWDSWELDHQHFQQSRWIWRWWRF